VDERVDGVLRSLATAVETGGLARVCEDNGVSLMVLFGSAAREGTSPRDIDLAVRFTDEGNVLRLLQDLYELTGYEGYDVLVLDRAEPLARERALVTGRPLHQAKPGAFANEQISAIMERLDTDEFRRMELELMGR
jgi:predicted nucleotidyltransferase